MRRLPRWLGSLLLVALGLLLGLAWCVRPRPVVLGTDPVPPLPGATNVKVRLEGNLILARPPSPNGVALVLYPGGRVPPQSYEFIARHLAGRGVAVAIPVMPLELAVLAPNRADEVRPRMTALGLPVRRLVVGGHSLGGAMAARYALGHPVDGLVLMGAYPAASDDLSGKSFPVLVLAAERDSVAELTEVRAGLPRLPPATRLTVIPGGVHAFFGRYGPQAGDGAPTVTRESFERELLGELTAFLEGVR